MARRIVSLAAVVIIIGIASVFAQNAQKEATKTASETVILTKEAASDNKNLVKGMVKEVSKDKTYIMVDNTKILTTKEFLDDSYLEAGDKVEITVEKVDAGLKAVSYNYIFEEDPSEDLELPDADLSKEPVAVDKE